MTVTYCPDCLGSKTMGRDCETCKGSRYIHRNSHGRIIEPATATEFLNQVRRTAPQTSRPSPQGYRTTYGRRLR